MQPMNFGPQVPIPQVQQQQVYMMPQMIQPQGQFINPGIMPKMQGGFI